MVILGVSLKQCDQDPELVSMVAKPSLTNSPSQLAQVESVREFNRFYTQHIGVLDEKLLDSDYSLSEARLLFEIAHNDQMTAADAADRVGLDRGYVSRMLRRFENTRLIKRTQSSEDGRRWNITLTTKGAKVFSGLNARSQQHAEAVIAQLTENQKSSLVDSMQSIRKLLDSERKPQARSYTLRSHRPGDMGWIVYRHGIIYHQEYGWDESFEALVANVLGDFIKNFDSENERCWIAESNGQFAGCVFLVKESESTARLRCLIVEPSARGLGIGTHLVRECIEFARRCGYARITLWTNSILDSARRIYQQFGFELVHEEAHHSFGHDLVSQTWDLQLADHLADHKD